MNQSRFTNQRTRTMITSMMVLLLVLPGIGQATPGGANHEEATWPPAAWFRGDIEALSQEQQAWILADVAPGSAAAGDLAAQLDRLDELPPEYAAVTAVGLRGLTQALWHQEAALAGFNPDEKRAWIAAQRGEPAAVGHLIGRVDHDQVEAALETLLEMEVAIGSILDARAPAPADSSLLADQQAPLGLAATMAGTSAAASGANGRPVHPAVPADVAAGNVDAAQLARDITLLAGLPADAASVEALEASLSQGPGRGLAAIAHIIEALLAAATQDVADDPEATIADVAQATQAVRPVLDTWAAQAAALRFATMVEPRFPVLPSPGEGLDLTAWTGLPTAAQPMAANADAAAALHDLAHAFGVPPDSAAIDAAAGQINTHLSPVAQRALVDFIAATAAQQIAAEAHLAMPLPAVLQARPDAVTQWAHDLTQGDVYRAGSKDAADIAAARPWLESATRAVEARSTLLAAASVLPAPLQAAADALGVDTCDSALPTEVYPLLYIDFCGVDNTRVNQTIISIDLAGDDTYLHRAGAPFVTPSDPGTSAGGATTASLVLGTSVLLDLGGNDTYDAGAMTCAQGAACPQHADGVAGSGSLNSTSLAAQRAPLALLLDLDGDGVNATNTFRAGAYSQGAVYEQTVFAIPSPDEPAQPVPAPSPSPRVISSLGLLVEQVGTNSEITSHYISADSKDVGQPGSQGAAYGDGRAALIRLLGDGTSGTATFTAGDASQGVYGGPATVDTTTPEEAFVPYPVSVQTAMFANIAGDGATSHDTYVAGVGAQGAQLNTTINRVAVLFADIVGSGGRSDDQYFATDLARGYDESPTGGGSTNSIVAFIDALQPNRPEYASAVGESTVAVGAKGAAATSDDHYNEIDTGFGVRAHFFDLGGNDSYPSAGPDGPNNDHNWGGAGGAPTGNDLGSDDPDGDIIPTAVEEAWNDQIGLWMSDPDDGDTTPLPSPAQVFLNWGDAPHVLNAAYGFVLSAAGDQVYGPAYSAALHFDLGGNDLVLGRTAAASGTVEAGTVVFSDAVNTVRDGPAGGGVVYDHTLSANNASMNWSASEPIAHHVLAYFLDAAGDDDYVSSVARNHGYGHAGTLGIHIDLVGNDTYQAPAWAQGVGDLGGVGALLDLGAPWHVGGTDVNEFTAQLPAHGDGTRGGLGFLVMTGAHNRVTASDSVYGRAGLEQDRGRLWLPSVCDTRSCLADEDVFENEYFRVVQGTVEGATGVRPPGLLEVLATGDRPSTYGGARADLGQNRLPIPRGVSYPQNPVDAGRNHTFSVHATDPDGDPMYACWLIDRDSSGAWREPVCRALDEEGTASIQAGWFHVPTTSETGDSLPYNVRLDVCDTSNLCTRAQEMPVFHVRNPGPEIRGDIRGPRTLHLVDGAAEAAFQLPYHADSVEGKVRTDAHWGERYEAGRRPVDWLDSRWGSRIELPFSTVLGEDRQRQVCTSESFPPMQAFDGDAATGALFEWESGCPAVSFKANLPGPRIIDTVELAAVASGASPPTMLALTALYADGSNAPLGSLTVSGNRMEDPSEVSLAVPEGDVTAISVRQVLPAGAGTREGNGVLIQSLRALGPGISHTFAQPGFQPYTLDIVNELGGGTSRAGAITVIGSAHREEVLYVDLASRGDVTRASVAADQEQTITLVGNITDLDAEACIDWGDGSPEDCIAPVVRGRAMTFTHTWSPGQFSVTQRFIPGQGPERTDVLAHVTSEVAYELTSDGDPLLFLALEADGGQTWYSGATPHLVVDAQGDDRYSGTVAAPRRALAQAATREAEYIPSARPSVVIDQAGNDDYVSDGVITQGAGHFATVGLLIDDAGDDIYIAGALAQGAAVAGGIGMLWDRGGDDAYNPVDPDHPAAIASLANGADPATGRQVQVGNRTVAAASGTILVQGAGLDGIGVLVDDAGTNKLRAGGFAQGYGGHIDDTLGAYFFADGHCGDSYVGNPPRLDMSLANLLCALGITQEPWNKPLDDLLAGTGVGQPQVDETGRHVHRQEAYGAGLGLLALPGGAALLDAQFASQGAAGPDGRGFLLDPDGATTLPTVAFGQGASLGGTAAAMFGGPALVLAGQSAQGVAYPYDGGPEAGDHAFAAFLAPTSAHVECGAWWDCGEHATLQDASTGPYAPYILEQLPGLITDYVLGEADRYSGYADGETDRLAAYLDRVGQHPAVGDPAAFAGDPTNETYRDGNYTPQPPEPPFTGSPPDTPPGVPATGVLLYPDNPAAPSVSVDVPVDTAAGGQVPVHVQVGGGTGPLDLVVMAQPTELHRFGFCLPNPIGPAVLVYEEVLPAGGDAREIQLDLDAMQDDGHVIPAGCLTVAAFATDAASQGTAAGDAGSAATGMGTDVFQNLRRPYVRLAEPVSYTPEGIVMRLRTDDALAGAGTGITSRFAFDGPQQHAIVSSGWIPDGRGARLNITWPIAGSTSGIYDVHVDTSWQLPGSPSGRVSNLATVAVDHLAPVVTPVPLPAAASGNLPLTVSGTAFDDRPLAYIHARLVNENGVVRLHDESTFAIADLTVLEQDGLTAWQVDLRPAATFTGGEVTVQVLPADVAGNVAKRWQSIGTLLLDYQAPKLANNQLTTASGSRATAADFPIYLHGHLDDASQAPGQCRLPEADADPDRLVTLPLCREGSGIDLATLTTTVLRPDGIIQALPATTVATADGGYAVTVEWDGEGRPPSGDYEVTLLVQDHVGNLLIQNPGTQIAVDRDRPEVLDLVVHEPAGPRVVLKPGDAFNLSAAVLDRHAGLSKVQWVIGDDLLVCDLSLAADGRWRRATPMPEQLDEPGDGCAFNDVPGNGATTLGLRAIDRAGNAIDLEQNMTLYWDPPSVSQYDASLAKANSLRIQFETDRPLDLDATTAALFAPNGTQYNGTVSGDGARYQARFADLPGDTAFDVRLQLADEAGWLTDFLHHAKTLPAQALDFAMQMPTEPILSGVIPLAGQVNLPVGTPFILDIWDGNDSLLHQTIRVGEPRSATTADGLFVFDGAAVRFDWDTTRRYPAVHDVDLRVEVDTIADLPPQLLPVTIDNDLPDLAVDVRGRDDGLGWFSGTVIVNATAQDASGPLGYRIRIDDGPWVATRDQVLDAPGTYEVTIESWDDAVPPNVAVQHQTVRLDRQVPQLTAKVPLPSPATRSAEIPLQVLATDELSGMQAFRVGSAGDWTEWSATAPSKALLDSSQPGEQWLDIEAKDRAGNIARRSISVVFDDEPPVVLGARWVGWNVIDQPIVHLVGLDSVTGGGIAAGVEAARFRAIDGAWTAWMPTDGRSPLDVPWNHYDADGITMQLRDHAGNVGPEYRYEEPVPVGLLTAAPVVREVAGPSLLRDAWMAPEQTNATDPVVFAVTAAPFAGHLPDSIWVEVRGERIRLLPIGDALEDEAQRYQATVLLPASDLTDPYTHRFVATYRADEVATPVAPGPVVLATGAGFQDVGRDTPAPTPLLVLVGAALAMLAIATRRKEETP